MKLLWTCPDHPIAEIRHTWDRTPNFFKPNPWTGTEHLDRNHRYECSECGRELAAPKEEK